MLKKKWLSMDHNMDRIYKNVFEDIQVDMPNEAWETALEAIKKEEKRKRKIIVWFSILAISSLILSTVLWLNITKVNSSTFAQKAVEENKPTNEKTLESNSLDTKKIIIDSKEVDSNANENQSGMESNILTKKIKKSTSNKEFVTANNHQNSITKSKVKPDVTSMINEKGVRPFKSKHRVGNLKNEKAAYVILEQENNLLEDNLQEMDNPEKVDNGVQKSPILGNLQLDFLQSKERKVTMEGLSMASIPIIPNSNQRRGSIVDLNYTNYNQLKEFNVSIQKPIFQKRNAFVLAGLGYNFQYFNTKELSNINYTNYSFGSNQINEKVTLKQVHSLIIPIQYVHNVSSKLYVLGAVTGQYNVFFNGGKEAQISGEQVMTRSNVWLEDDSLPRFSAFMQMGGGIELKKGFSVHCAVNVPIYNKINSGLGMNVGLSKELRI